jgi:hypothetical protein
VYALGGSLGTVILRVERPFASSLKIPIVSAAAGFSGQNLLLCRISGAPEQFICALSAVGAALFGLSSVYSPQAPAFARLRAPFHAASARGVNIWGRLCVRDFALIAA